MKHFDVIIIGGSYVGLSMALLLAAKGLKSLIIEKQAKERKTVSREPSRLIAIARASCEVYSDFSLDFFTDTDVQPINFIRVLEEATGAYIDFDPEKIGISNFGYMIEEQNLIGKLFERVSNSPNIQYIQGITLSDIKDDGTLVEVITQQGKSFKARLLVAADGKNSWVRKYMGIRAHRYDYRQTAIVADILHELPHDGAAIEKFMPQGPFAILPKSDGFSSAIVWTIASENADDMRELSQDDLKSIIISNFGDYLGELKLMSEIKFFPLELVHAESYIATRIALVGDSAHAMHPIAGQGLNLGIRDIKELISLIIEYHELGIDIGSESLLKRYEKNRYPDNNFMLAATHNLNLLFANESRLLRKIRGLGMKMVNGSETAKKFFMEYASGIIHLTR